MGHLKFSFRTVLIAFRRIKTQIILITVNLLGVFHKGRPLVLGEASNWQIWTLHWYNFITFL